MYYRPNASGKHKTYVECSSFRRTCALCWCKMLYVCTGACSWIDTLYVLHFVVNQIFEQILWTKRRKRFIFKCSRWKWAHPWTPTNKITTNYPPYVRLLPYCLLVVGHSGHKCQAIPTLGAMNGWQTWMPRMNRFIHWMQRRRRRRLFVVIQEMLRLCNLFVFVSHIHDKTHLDCSKWCAKQTITYTMHPTKLYVRIRVLPRNVDDDDAVNYL